MKKAKYGLLLALASLVISGCGVSVKNPTSSSTPSPHEPTHTHEHTPSEPSNPTEDKPSDPTAAPDPTHTHEPTPSSVPVTPTEIKEGEEINLFFTSNEELRADFANSLENVVNQINNADAIGLSTDFSEFELHASLDESIRQHNYETNEMYVQNFGGALSIDNANLHAEAALSGLRSGNTGNLLGYAEISDFNADFGGNFHIDESIQNPVGVPHSGEFNFQLKDGGAAMNFQNGEFFLDFSNTGLISFANAVLSSDLFDFSAIFNVEDVDISGVLEKYHVSTKVRSGQIVRPTEMPVATGLIPLTAKDILMAFEMLNSDDMVAYHPLIRAAMQYLHLKTIRYNEESPIAYGFSIEIPDLNTLVSLGDLITGTMLSGGSSFSDLLKSYGVVLSSAYIKINLLICKNGTVNLALDFSVKGDLDTDRAPQYYGIDHSEERSGLARAFVDAELSFKNVTALSFPHSHEVSEHALSEAEQKDYLFRCFNNHHFESKNTTLDQCHVLHQYICTECGFISSENIEERHDYVMSLDNNKVVSKCSKCHETITHNTYDYAMNDENGSPFDFEITSQLSFFRFVPEKDGIYVFTTSGKIDTYGHIYDESFAELARDDDRGVGSNFAVNAQLDAGKTYYIGARLFSSYDKTSYQNQLECYLNRCIGEVHLGTFVETSVVIDPCHTSHDYVCSVCGESSGKSYISTNHTFDYNNVISEPLDACHTTYYYICTTCGERCDYRESEHHNVDWNNPVIVQRNSCIVEYRYVCTVCSQVVDYKTEEHHNYNKSTVEVGEYHYRDNYVCSDCGASYSMDLYRGFEFPFDVEISNSYTLLEFIPEEDGYYAFYTLTNFDTVGTIYDAGLNQIAFDDDDGDDNNFFINYYLEAGQTYYIGVRAYNDEYSILCTVYCEMNKCGEIHIGPFISSTNVIDACHTEYIETCSVCGEVTSKYVNTNHVSVDWENQHYEVISACETYYYYICTECNEVAEEYRDAHHTVDWNNPVINQIDSCHEKCEYYCTVCDYLYSTSYNEKHNYVESRFEIDDSHYQVVYTCSNCGDSYANDYYSNVSFPTTLSITGALSYIEFVPEESGYYSFESNCERDTYGYIYNESFEELYTDDDSAGNGNFRVSYFLEEGHTYYIGVRLYNKESREHYLCSIEMQILTCGNGEHYGEVEEIVDNSHPCYTVYNYVCTLCGEVVNSNKSEHHTNVDWNNQYHEEIDPCHTRYYYICLDCGEHANEYISENHHANLDNPVVEEIDSCHTKNTFYCTDCGEVCTYTISDHHNYVESRVQIDDNHYRIIRTCEGCGDSYSYDCYSNAEFPYSCQITGETTYLEYTPSESGYYYIYSSSNTDTYGYLLNSEMEELCYNDDGGEENNFKMYFYLEAGQTYYIGARLYAAGSSDVYDCTINVVYDCAEA